MVHFYSFNKEKFILVSNINKEAIKKRFGHQFEVLTSIKDLSAIEIVLTRIQRQFPTFQIKRQVVTKVTFTPEVREKLRKAKLGTKKPDEVKRKISQSRKGIGNFLGKSHSEESKRTVSLKLRGRKNSLGKRWVYNTKTGKESLVKGPIPEGCVLGRDQEVVELFASNLVRNRASTTLPTKKQSKKDQ